MRWTYLTSLGATISTGIFAGRNTSRALRLKTSAEPHATEQNSYDQFQSSESVNKTTANELTRRTERSNVIDGRYDGLWTREWNLMAGQRQNIQVRMRQRLIQAMRILVRGHDLV